MKKTYIRIKDYWLMPEEKKEEIRLEIVAKFNEFYKNNSVEVAKRLVWLNTEYTKELVHVCVYNQENRAKMKLNKALKNQKRTRGAITTYLESLGVDIF